MPGTLASAAGDTLVLQCLPRSSCMLAEDRDGDSRDLFAH